MKIPMGKSSSCIVDKYIGSDFDYVKEVANNLETIEHLGPIADDLDEVIKSIDEIRKLADNLEEFQVNEVIQLEVQQQVVTFEKVIPRAIALYVLGPQTDSKRLLVDDDYILSTADSIYLKRTYPQGTKLLAVQTIVADKGVSLIYDDRTVFNRSVVPFGIGSVLKDTVINGEAVAPLLVYDKKQYICHDPLPIEHVITSHAVFPVDDIHIEISVEAAGEPKKLILDMWDARALTQRDIIYLFQEGMQNILVRPPQPWTPFTTITSVTYHIRVDGIDYFPKVIPFTTKGQWSDDIVNWLEIRGRKPCEVDLTDSISIELCDWTTNLLVSSRDVGVTNIVSFSNVEKYRKVTLIPVTDNIVLIHNDRTLRLNNALELRLSTNSVYEFFIDHEGIPRQLA